VKFQFPFKMWEIEILFLIEESSKTFVYFLYNLHPSFHLKVSEISFLNSQLFSHVDDSLRISILLFGSIPIIFFLLFAFIFFHHHNFNFFYPNTILKIKGFQLKYLKFLEFKIFKILNSFVQTHSKKKFLIRKILNISNFIHKIEKRLQEHEGTRAYKNTIISSFFQRRIQLYLFKEGCALVIHKKGGMCIS